MSRVNPVVLVLIAIASVQFGASLAKGVFDEAGPATLAFLRVGIATLVLLAVARPRLRGRSAHDWVLVSAYGLCLTGMNTAIYFSFARIPIGVAVTLEFIGPLALGLIGSRRLLDLLWVGLAAVGVVLLGALPLGIDVVGAGLALLAGALWAGYIALAGPVGRRWEGLSALTVGNGIGALLLAVPAIALAGDALGRTSVWAVMALVALLSTVVPYALELMARRSIRASTFGILMSLEPAAAGLFALILLGEVLGPVELAAMACVIVASVGAIRSARSATPAPVAPV